MFGTLVHAWHCLLTAASKHTPKHFGTVSLWVARNLLGWLWTPIFWSHQLNSANLEESQEESSVILEVLKHGTKHGLTKPSTKPHLRSHLHSPLHSPHLGNVATHAEQLTMCVWCLADHKIWAVPLPCRTFAASGKLVFKQMKGSLRFAWHTTTTCYRCLWQSCS